MRGLIISLAGSAMCIAGISTAVAQTPHFRGSACIYAVNAGCAAEGWTPGQCAAARFTPPDYFGSGNITKLSFFWGYYSQNFTYPEGSLIGTGFKPLTAVQIGNSGSTYTAYARLTSQTAVNPGTLLVTAVGDIANFAPSCMISFIFQGQRIPFTVPAVASTGGGENSSVVEQLSSFPAGAGLSNQGTAIGSLSPITE